MSPPAAGANAFYAAPAVTSVGLRDAIVFRCLVTERGSTVVGTAPAGATSTLTRREFAVTACEARRGDVPGGPLTLVGFTMLAPPQRHDDRAAPTLRWDGQRFFDRPAQAEAIPVLIIAGGAPVVPPMGFEGNAATLQAGAASWPARVLGLDAGDAGLDAALAHAVGWAKDLGPDAYAAARAAGHPLIQLDALQVALADGRSDAAVPAATALVAAAAPAAARIAAVTAIEDALARDGQRVDADRLRALVR